MRTKNKVRLYLKYLAEAGNRLSTAFYLLFIIKMAKIVYDDGAEKDFNEADFISREDLDENYISKEDLAENYVSREKYNQKKQQAKNAFANQDKAKKEALDEEAEKLRASIMEEVSFTTRHGFDQIPEEVQAIRAKHPTLSLDEALQISGYQGTSGANPNPWRANPNAFNPQKTEYTLEELAQLPQEQYDTVASRIEKGEVKKVL